MKKKNIFVIEKNLEKDGEVKRVNGGDGANNSLKIIIDTSKSHQRDGIITWTRLDSSLNYNLHG